MATIGVNKNGHREVVGYAEGFTEPAECWRDFLSWLKPHWLRGIRMLTGNKAYRKAEISRNTAHSHLAKNDLPRPGHPSVPLFALGASTRATRQSQCLRPAPLWTGAHIEMRHLQRTRTPPANFWAVSQVESARNATARRRFPRSAEPTANNPRRKPHRSQGPMAKSAPISCETTQNPRGGRPRAKPRQP